MKIAVASGKGGTGKTFVATNMAALLADMGEAVTLADCDVEEPNSQLFIKPEIIETCPVTIEVPVIDNDKCTGCRLCSSHCEFHALITVKSKTYVFEDMCHACGFCMRICPENAIGKRDKTIGTFSKGQFGRGLFMDAEMKIGTELATPVIKFVKDRLPANGMLILDSPPGTSCPVVETIQGCDYVILVTEPTSFGLNDLKLAVEMCRELKLKVGVVENRAMEKNTMVADYCRDENIRLLASIPLEREIAECYSHGNLVIRELPAYRYRFVGLIDAVKEELGQ